MRYVGNRNQSHLTDFINKLRNASIYHIYRNTIAEYQTGGTSAQMLGGNGARINII
jgi:hypothetical protein